uniref:Uncharacterized protein n=1 Tax=Salarias fasciatus TaxID=181472 RepID=A0A672III0_SALFA
VVESSGPVDGDVRLLLINRGAFVSRTHRASCGELAELKQTVEHRTVLSNIDYSASLTSLHLLAVLGHVVRPDRPQELDVVVTVVLGHLLTAVHINVTHINLHFPVQSIVEEEVVCHADPVWFHRMTLAIVVVPHIAYVRGEQTSSRGLQERDMALLLNATR